MRCCNPAAHETWKGGREKKMKISMRGVVEDAKSMHGNHVTRTGPHEIPSTEDHVGQICMCDRSRCMGEKPQVWQCNLTTHTLNQSNILTVLRTVPSPPE
jgi:hypothetical protein